MNISKMWILVIAVPLIIVVIVVGGWYGLKLNKEKEIKDSFSKTLNMYPIKNLEDLYDKEGFRDENFDKNDKGKWILNSDMGIEKSGGDLKSKGMLLNINRNKREATGYYYETIYSDDIDKYDDGVKETRYPVEMKNNKIYLTKKVKDKKIEEEIKNFKFFSQYGNFKDIDSYKNGDITYNPEVPSYSAKYQLNNSNFNVKQIRERYDLPTKKAPKLVLKGDGDLKGSSVGTKDIEFIFVRNKKDSISLKDSIEFKPAH
ncbi:tandem-type lipoprotein [Staphylococcus caprae]|uniref:tandem-type lipoprotein n=1 Tax=Staphylococcus caprae TaxID=29380 RepID=UPI001C1183A5|nr:tandem-type lipoprotein [Staphylococcus caprae]MBU5271894.1 tandem-type lipoprotein [Staphylococcus caprae]